jgi:hypothetical protein
MTNANILFLLSLMYLACCAVTFGLNDFKLGKGITQSILNGFAQKKLQNVQKIRGYNVNTTTRQKPADPLVPSPKEL